MKKGHYRIITSSKSRCKCGKSVHLLCCDAVGKPLFFICWPCKAVYQVGVGEVKEEL